MTTKAWQQLGRRWTRQAVCGALLALVCVGLAVGVPRAHPARSSSRSPLPAVVLGAPVRESSTAPAGHGRLGASVLLSRPQPARSPRAPLRPASLVLPAGWSSRIVPLQVGPLSRSYLLVRAVPEPGVKLPVLVVLAGRGMTPTVMARWSGFPAVTGPAIIVYPAGYGYSWNAGACCGVAQHAGINDVAFLNAVVRQVLASQPDAAADQIYMIGYSNGGRMAYRLACADPGTFAGMAAVEAVPVSTCSRLAPLPVDIVASSGDPLLSISAATPTKVIRGYVEPRVDDVVGQWRALEGCNGVPAVSMAGRATLQTWDRCRGAGRLQYTLYTGGSHIWPMGGGTTPPAERLVWSFLRPKTTTG